MNEPDRDSELWKALNSVGSSDDAYLIATAHAEKRVANLTDTITAMDELVAGLKARINKLEAEALAWMNSYEAAERKLMETPWEVRSCGGHLYSRHVGPDDAKAFLRLGSDVTATIRNAVTGEEVK